MASIQTKEEESVEGFKPTPFIDQKSATTAFVTVVLVTLAIALFYLSTIFGDKVLYSFAGHAVSLRVAMYVLIALIGVSLFMTLYFT